MLGIVAAVFGKWRLQIAGVALILAAVLGVYLKGRHAGIEASAKLVAAADARTADVKSQLINCNAARQAQEAAVQALRDQSATWVAKSQKAASDARAVADILRRKAQDVIAEKPSSSDLCVEAEKVLRQ